MTTHLAVLPPGTTEIQRSLRLTQALHTNLGTYEQLAGFYEKTGAARLVQAQRWLRPVLTPMRHAIRRLSVLELGPADGFLTGYISELGHDVTAVEFASSMSAATRRHAPRAKVIEADFLTCELNTNYDVIICSAFVHLFPSPWDVQVLERVATILSPTGLAYLATTTHKTHTSGFETKTDGLRRYRTRYTVSSFEEVLRSAGLVPIEFYTTKDRLSPEKVWGNWLVRGSAS